METKKIKRYAVTMSYYIEASNEEEAIKEANLIASEQRKEYDDDCSVDSVHEAIFGEISRKKIFPKK